METITEKEYLTRIKLGIPFNGYVTSEDGSKYYVNLKIRKRVALSQGEYEQKIENKDKFNETYQFLNKSFYGSSVFAALGQYTHPIHFGKYYNYLGKLHPLKGGIPYNKFGNAILPSSFANYSKHAKWSLSNYKNWAAASKYITSASIILESVNAIENELDEELSREDKNKKHIKSGVNITFSVVSFGGLIGAGISVVYFSVDIFLGDENEGGWEKTYRNAAEAPAKLERNLQNAVYNWFYSIFQWY